MSTSPCLPSQDTHQSAGIVRLIPFVPATDETDARAGVLVAGNSLTQPVWLQVYSQEGSTEVPKNPDPDESIVLDFADARALIVERLSADGVFCEKDAATVERFDAPLKVLSIRTRARRAFESLMRNGYTRYTAAAAEDAGIAVIVSATTRDVVNVVAFPTPNPLEAA